MCARSFLAPLVHRKGWSDAEPAVLGGLFTFNIGGLMRSRERIWS
jgi:hypothetical protein